MGVSETIIAASIGATATVMTALFQLFGAIRNSSRSGAPPKRGSTRRSIVAVLALMIASGVGGYMLSELRQERTSQDLRSIRDELSAKLQMVEANTALLAAREAAPAATSGAVASTHQPIEREAAIYVPACGGACSEAQPQSMALCDAIPAALQVTHLDLFVRAASAQHDWELSRVKFEQDADGGRFVGGIQEQADASDQKNVCVTFVHSGTKPLVARMVLRAAALPEMSAPESTGAQPASSFGAEAVATQLAGSRAPGAPTSGPAAP